MEVRDPVHGPIQIFNEEIPILTHPFFQRLRSIKQLGFSEYSFPGATHTRYLHSIGVMHVNTQAFDKIFKPRSSQKELLRLRETVRLAGLLHDIGHAPLSHSTESVMPQLSELNLSSKFLAPHDQQNDRQATHEDYTLKAIVDSSFTESFKQVRDKYGVDPNAIASLVSGHVHDEGYFVLDGVNYYPLMQQLVSSEMDCDRMDYLLRDSYFCGVSYGKYDLDWIIDNLEACEINGKYYLGISDRAIWAFDDFLLGRFHMFLMVYFHYRAVCLEKMLLKYFKDSPNEYRIPADIEEYRLHDDHYLAKILKASENPWAKKIVKNQIPDKIFESINSEQEKSLAEVEKFLNEENIEYIKCSSRGRLSKYYNESKGEEASGANEQTIMKVARKIHGTDKKTYTNINEATDLFMKFSSSHSIIRLHCDLDELSQAQKDELIALNDKAHQI